MLNVKKTISYLIIFTLFMDGFTLREGLLPFDFRISYLIYIVVFFISLFILKDVYINRIFIVLLMLITLTSLFNVYVGNDTILLLLEQLIGIALSALVYYQLFKIVDYDIKKVFNIYLNIALIICFIGIFQEICFVLKFKPGYDFSWFIPEFRLGISNSLIRINSITPEPASLGTTIMPAFFASLLNIFHPKYRLLKNWQAGVIILTAFITISSVAYIGILISVILLVYNKYGIKSIAVSGVIVLILFGVMYNCSKDFKVRVDDTYNVITGNTDINESNLSTFALLSNAQVAYKSFKNQPLIGSGLGSHQISYDKYIDTIADKTSIGFELKLNRTDANSLFLRLMSETGLVGLLAVILFIICNYVKKDKNENDIYWIINNAVLTLIILRLLRSGHYFSDGFFFFIWLYYFSKRQYKSVKKLSEARLYETEDKAMLESN